MMNDTRSDDTPRRDAEEIVRLPIDAIVVEEDRRRDPGDVTELAGSINEIGLLNPVTVDGDRRLIAGWRRLCAVRQLGWQTVPARVVVCDPVRHALMELDENLERLELSALERAEAFGERKALYELLHPEARHGGDRRSVAVGRPDHVAETATRSGTPSFADAMAASTGKSARTIRDNLYIAEHLNSEARKFIAGTPLADQKTELLALAKLSAEDQIKTSRRIALGQARNVKDAQRQIERESFEAFAGRLDLDIKQARQEAEPKARMTAAEEPAPAPQLVLMNRQADQALDALLVLPAVAVARGVGPDVLVEFRGKLRRIKAWIHEIELELP